MFDVRSLASEHQPSYLFYLLHRRTLGLAVGLAVVDIAPGACHGISVAMPCHPPCPLLGCPAMASSLTCHPPYYFILLSGYHSCHAFPRQASP